MGGPGAVRGPIGSDEDPRETGSAHDKHGAVRQVDHFGRHRPDKDPIDRPMTASSEQDEVRAETVGLAHDLGCHTTLTDHGADHSPVGRQIGSDAIKSGEHLALRPLQVARTQGHGRDRPRTVGPAIIGDHGQQLDRGTGWECQPLRDRDSGDGRFGTVDGEQDLHGKPPCSKIVGVRPRQSMCQSARGSVTLAHSGPRGTWHDRDHGRYDRARSVHAPDTHFAIGGAANGATRVAELDRRRRPASGPSTWPGA